MEQMSTASLSALCQAKLSLSFKQMLSKYLKHKVLKGANFLTAELDNVSQASLALLSVAAASFHTTLFSVPG